MGLCDMFLRMASKFAISKNGDHIDPGNSWKFMGKMDSWHKIDPRPCSLALLH